MREILFRGKRKDNGEWVEGGYVGKTCKTILPEAEASAQIIDNDLFWHEVILGTVGQYTGLIDRNGVKIFEGDIVTGTAYSFERIGVIVWIDEIAGFGILYPKREEAAALVNTSILKCLSKGRRDQFAAAVIGNIHDNPELMKGEEK